MEIKTKITIMVLVAPLLGGCVMKSFEDVRKERVAESIRQQEIATARENEKNMTWSVRCLTDQVTTVRRCWAGTFARAMSSDGSAYGRADKPFQISYWDDLGPMIIFLNNYPGKKPTIRIDHNPPVTFDDEELNPDIVAALRTGEVARVRYYVWPKGYGEDMLVVLRGLNEALDELDRQRRQR